LIETIHRSVDKHSDEKDKRWMTRNNHLISLNIDTIKTSTFSAKFSKTEYCRLTNYYLTEFTIREPMVLFNPPSSKNLIGLGGIEKKKEGKWTIYFNNYSGQIVSKNYFMDDVLYFRMEFETYDKANTVSTNNSTSVNNLAGAAIDRKTAGAVMISLFVRNLETGKLMIEYNVENDDEVIYFYNGDDVEEKKEIVVDAIDIDNKIIDNDEFWKKLASKYFPPSYIENAAKNVGDSNDETGEILSPLISLIESLTLSKLTTFC
jgi:hypothetical protein